MDDNFDNSELDIVHNIQLLVDVHHEVVDSYPAVGHHTVVDLVVDIVVLVVELVAVTFAEWVVVIEADSLIEYVHL